jgi:hypothetical protein
VIHTFSIFVIVWPLFRTSTILLSPHALPLSIPSNPAVHFPLSTFHFPLSTFHFPLSSLSFPTPLIPSDFSFDASMAWTKQTARKATGGSAGRVKLVDGNSSAAVGRQDAVDVCEAFRHNNVSVIFIYLTSNIFF